MFVILPSQADSRYRRPLKQIQIISPLADGAECRDLGLDQLGPYCATSSMPLSIIGTMWQPLRAEEIRCRKSIWALGAPGIVAIGISLMPGSAA